MENQTATVSKSKVKQPKVELQKTEHQQTEQLKTEICKVVTTAVTLLIPVLESIPTLKSMNERYNVSPIYRTQEEWEKNYLDLELRCFYLGLRQLPNGKGEFVDCGLFADASGLFLAAQMTLIDAVRNWPAMTPILIIYKGRKPNKNSPGSTNVFKVTILGENV